MGTRRHLGDMGSLPARGHGTGSGSQDWFGDMEMIWGHRTGLGTQGQSGDTGVPPGSETQGWFGDRWLSREYRAGLGTWSLSRLRVWYGNTGTVWGHWEQFWDTGTRGWSRLGVWGWCGDAGSVWGHQVCPRSRSGTRRRDTGPVWELGVAPGCGSGDTGPVWGH